MAKTKKRGIFLIAGAVVCISSMALSFFSQWNLPGDDNAAGSFFSQFLDFDSEVSDAFMGFHMPECSPIHSVDFVFSSPPPLPTPPVSWTARGERVPHSISPQSVAARGRRKKISAKTEELGRLIPGGEKMSTANMLVAAHKYVRFLQAEESVLQYMNDQKVSRGKGEELLQVLLASPKIQERLSSEGKCLVPKEMVDHLVAEHLIVSNQFTESDETIY
ncbi:hypothetical protein KFK09_018088 [Dendrobium nobile]|uniref:BHLH domain-containing protein n=1 Tax=Dendrobium nobile TaxID=94219 RepID=A0A8T3AUS6_DENNO|nr:hypothetical protein KFK09_018088 [Dendrobium nobile]